jgi:hypothetical protein
LELVIEKAFSNVAGNREGFLMLNRVVEKEFSNEVGYRGGILK